MIYSNNLYENSLSCNIIYLLNMCVSIENSVWHFYLGKWLLNAHVSENTQSKTCVCVCVIKTYFIPISQLNQL